ncbi:AraC family transcriptional regulator [Adlercreutzia sp. R21]|uniref:AraC family transcriptional regulator n=1 Tax=Adlercreutzia wanghongyangiae TaxID=3111451 RepID=A0ABU6IH71_9ACTN|nr:AraC family transcriptional regulator [Adlercreutzia sp. R21]MEC4175793.1 AraC family transcriptional regulator [Adlercreutzia sp. R7]MEC4183823.1 AraC family transcriptional regulator [Adlercreutzia sp. R21]
MEAAPAPHTESVRRTLNGTIELRRFAGLDQPFAPHAHDYPVIGLMRQGHRLMECNRRRYRLGPGHLLALNPGDAHGCTQEGASPLAYDSVALIGIPDCPPLAGPVANDPEAAAYMGAVVAFMEAPEPDNARIEEALCLLVGRLASAPATAPDDRAAQSMAAYLRDHASQSVRLEEVAQAAGLDKYRALRTFSSTFGLTPMRYLASLRVERARELLVAGASCAEAACAAGFSDQAHLTRAFKERLGTTPGRYQRAVRGNAR